MSRHGSKEAFSPGKREIVHGGESHPTRDACLPKFCEFHEIQFRELGIFNDGSLKHSEMGPLSYIVGSQG